MNYISTKEASVKWGISPRRITQLAKDGRINGSVLRDRRWLIPENAPKPEDPRSTDAKAEAMDDGYVFPYIIATVHSKVQLECFSDDEKALYNADCLCEEGKLEECSLELNRLLLKTDNRFIRLGALYLLSIVYFYQSDFENMSKSAEMFKLVYFENDAHRNELAFLYESMNAEIFEGQGFTFKEVLSRPFDYSGDIVPYISTVNAVAELTNSNLGDITININSHEIICAEIEQNGYFYCALILHGYISMMYSLRLDKANEQKHLRKAIDMAIEHNAYFTLTEILAFNPDAVMETLKDYPDDVVNTFRKCASMVINARVAMSEYSFGSTLLFRLHQEDYVLISYCLKNFSIKKIAELLTLSESGVKKRLSSLYKKLEVDNRKDMLQRYVTLILNYESGNTL